MSGYFCCCSPGLSSGAECATFSDPFNGADGSGLGSAWSPTGTWTHQDGKASHSGTGSIRLDSMPTRDGDGSGRPADFNQIVTLNAGADDVTVRMGMGDIRATFNFANNTISVGGVTQSFPLAAGTNYHVRMTYEGPSAFLFVNGAYVMDAIVSGPIGGQPNLEVQINPSSAAVTFDDYHITIHNVNLNCISTEYGAHPCGYCLNGTTARRYQVVVAGVVAGTCGGDQNCAAIWNRTFVIEQCYDRPRETTYDCNNAPQMLSECLWGLGFEAQQTFCNDGGFPDFSRAFYHLDLGLSEDGALVRFWYLNGRAAYFKHPTWVQGQSCLFNGAGFTFDPALSGGSPNCDFSAATCTVTAL